MIPNQKSKVLITKASKANRNTTLQINGYKLLSRGRIAKGLIEINAKKGLDYFQIIHTYEKEKIKAKCLYTDVIQITRGVKQKQPFPINRINIVFRSGDVLRILPLNGKIKEMYTVLRDSIEEHDLQKSTSNLKISEHPESEVNQSPETRIIDAKDSSDV